jgi:MoaA/NifB/PqqE/SkfB family radical SAM enzyme/Tfp pilus assembly protein PilF
MDANLIRAYDSARSFENKAFRSACYAPFVSMFFTTDGRVLACCKNGSYVLGQVPQQRLADIWHGERTQQLRKALREYRFNLDCGYCEWEISGGQHKTATPLMFDELAVASASPDWPTQIEFEGSNTCNFECIMCNGDTSSSIRANRDGLPPLPRPYGDEFFADLRPFLPHLKRARFFGGEPFLTPESMRMWHMMIAEGLSTECHVTTNGSQYNAAIERVMEALPFYLVVSIDGATKKTVEKIRVNCHFEQLIENIRRFQAYATRRGTSFHLAFCLMRQNWHEFGDLLLFAETLDTEVWVNTVIDPSFCSLYTLPPREIARIADALEKQGETLRPRLIRNGFTWDLALGKLRSTADAIRTTSVAELLERHYVPDHPVQTASNLIRLGRHGEALDTLKTVAEKDPRQYYASDLRGYCHNALGHTKEAERHVIHALKLTRKRPEAHLTMARVRLKEGRLQEAQEAALSASTLALKEDRVHVEALELLAFLHAKRGRIWQALKVLRPIATLQAQGFQILGLVYPHEGLRRELLTEISVNPRSLTSRGVYRLVSLLLAVERFAQKWRTMREPQTVGVSPSKASPAPFQ